MELRKEFAPGEKWIVLDRIEYVTIPLNQLVTKLDMGEMCVLPWRVRIPEGEVDVPLPISTQICVKQASDDIVGEKDVILVEEDNLNIEASMLPKPPDELYKLTRLKS